MSKTQVIVLFLSFTLLLIIIAGCSSEVEIDSLINSPGEEDRQSAELSCITCHNSEYNLDPLETGKHTKHIIDKNYACIKCHDGYTDTSFHMDGNIDAGNNAVDLVIFDSTNPYGTWQPASGSCATTACHGAAEVDWYGTGNGWTMPSNCSACHSMATDNIRQIVGPGGDFNNKSTHLFDNGNSATTNDCLTCHDQNSHMDGNVSLKDINTGGVIEFDPGNPVSVDALCMNCHANDMDEMDGMDMTGLSCFGNENPATNCHSNDGQINAHIKIPH